MYKIKNIFTLIIQFTD